MIFLSSDRNGKTITEYIFKLFQYFSINNLLNLYCLRISHLHMLYFNQIKFLFPLFILYLRKPFFPILLFLKKKKETLWFYVELLIWVHNHVSEHGQSVSQRYHSWRNWILSLLGDIKDNTLQQGMGYTTTSHRFGILTALIFYGFYTYSNGCYKFKCAGESKHFCFALVIHFFWLLLSLLPYIFQDDPISL